MDKEIGTSEKFSRCIICSDFTVHNHCFNIFSTTLENGKILLSEFLKNVLGCTVLIVVSPEFFICKRCFTLCHELDCCFSRCNDLQGEIRTLFRNSERKTRLLHEDDTNKENLQITSDIEPQKHVNEEVKEETYWEETVQEEQEEYYYGGQLGTVEEVKETDDMDPNFFLRNEIVESEVTVGDTNNFEEEENCEDPMATQIEVAEQQNHKNAEENVVLQNNKYQDDMLVCDVCNLCFENEKILTAHKNSNYCKREIKSKVKSIYEFQHFSVKLKKKKKVYYCNRCTFEADSSLNISKHLKSHKTDPEYMCDICGKRFKYLKTFHRHQQVHDESRPFACKLCSFRAMTELILRIHERQHNDQKKYSCSKCGYKTLKKMSFLIHCRTHTGERPYCCPDCPYKAKDPSTLQRHRRIHGGIRRYQCTICDYKGTQKAALTVHMMTHTGEKPYACEHCDYRSSAKHNLQAHVAAIHSDEKPFACTHCTYKTKLKRLLTYHMRRHSDEKPFACPYCDHRVKYRSALSYHMNKKHPVNEEGVVQTYYVLNFCESKKLKFNGEDLVFSDEADSGSENEGQ